MIEVYIYLLLGMLGYFLTDFATFSKSVPGISGKLAQLDVYIGVNFLYMCSGLILGVAIVSLTDIGDLPFLANIGFPLRQSPESAFVLGLLNQWIVIKVRKFKNSLLVETRNENVIKANDIL